MHRFKKIGGISRGDMPQIKSILVTEFLRELTDKGIAWEEAMIPAAELRPSQAELHESNILSLIAANNGSLDKPLLVSKDFYVLDGHHRWAANQRLNRNQACRLINLTGVECLMEMAEFASRHQSLCGNKE